MTGMGVSTFQVIMQYVLLALQGFFWLALGVGALVAAFAFQRFVSLKETAFARKVAAHDAHHGVDSTMGMKHLHHKHGHHAHAHGHGSCGCGGLGAEGAEVDEAEEKPAVDVTPFID